MIKRVSIFLFALFLWPAQTFAQSAVSNAGGAPPNIEAIIRAFAAKETEFRQALNQYSFKRDAVIQTIGMGGQITGEYHRVSQ
ncbi:MAG: hypothetical protein IRZ19_11180, partial [Pyrinomonas methylaliphatogenes]|nr:hypothetical protein [Pyrinomonas methylaliphatogenes]